jgi:hypothetical protein
MCTQAQNTSHSRGPRRIHRAGLLSCTLMMPAISGQALICRLYFHAPPCNHKRYYKKTAGFLSMPA